MKVVVYDISFVATAAVVDDGVWLARISS